VAKNTSGVLGLGENSPKDEMNQRSTLFCCSASGLFMTKNHPLQLVVNTPEIVSNVTIFWVVFGGSNGRYQKVSTSDYLNWI
jgi:hypothetical protein